MSQIRFPNEINPALPGIICISHGPMACAVVESAEMILGELENVAALGLEVNDSLEEYRRELQEMWRKMPENTVLLIDLFGGSPFNVLMKIIPELKRPVYALSGLNLPMVLEIAQDRETHADGKMIISNTMESYRKAAVDVGEFVMDLMET
ncbi:MAG: PTS sugar transporter subunit IIA [Hespellia sp.]|jgi:PTS system mannose-specific IIA component|nr:PTS sugar transporter subunit IIA [Hespellia sp.]